MAQTVKLKRTSVANRHATTSHIEVGELAFNSNDKSLFIRGDSNAIVTLHDEDTLHIDHSNNRVGIGTASPQVPLHVSHATAPNFRLSRTGTGQIYQFGIDSSNRFLIQEAASEGGTKNTRFVIDDTGEVGIGTSSPSHLLHVTGADGSIANMVVNNDNVALRMSAYTNSHGEIRVETNHPLVFKTNGNNERMRVTSAGNVGIGTASPSFALDVRTANGNTLARFKDSDSSHSGIVIAGDTNAGWVGNDVGVTGEGIYYQSSNNLMRFYTNSAERIRILSDGKVGIGTSSPTHNLHVKSTGNAEVDVERASGAKINLQAQSAAGYIGTDSNHVFGLKANSTVRLKIATSGAISFNDAYTFPTADGTADQVLATDGLGALSFVDAGSGGGGVSISNNANNRVLTGDGTNANAEANLTFDGNTGIFSNSIGTFPLRTYTPYDYVAKFESTDSGAAIIIEDNNSTSNANRVAVSGNTMKLITAATTALTIDASQNATFAGTVASGRITTSEDLRFSGTPRIRADGVINFLTIGGSAQTGKFKSVAAQTNYANGASDGMFNALNGYAVGTGTGTTVIDSSRYIYAADSNSSTTPSITFTGHTNTGLSVYQSNSVDRLSIITGGAQRVNFGTHGVESFANVYTGASSSFRNYAGTWTATTGVTGNGFSFINSVDGTALTLSSGGNAVFAGTISSGAITTSGNITLNDARVIHNNTTFSTFDWNGPYQDANGKLLWTVVGTSGAEMELSSDGSAYGNAVLNVGGQQVITAGKAQTLTNKTLTSPVLNTGVSGTAVKDEDNMASNSATHLATQQSIKAYVDTEVAGVVSSAPAALNTLNELAAALGDDANFSATTSTSLGNRLRVDTASQGLTGTKQDNAITNLGITATKAELNFVDGVTSNIQTQLNTKLNSSSAAVTNKLPLAGGTMTGNINLNDNDLKNINLLQFKNRELADFDGSMQMILDANDGDSNVPAHGDCAGGNPFGIYFTGDNDQSTTTLGSGLSKVWHTGHFNKAHIDYFVGLYNTGVTTTEYDYLDGVTSNIQTQLNGKLSTSGIAAQANNLNATDDRDIAPDDLSFSDDLRIYFADKGGLETGTIGANYQDVLVLNSYSDATGGDANALAFDKSEKKIYHYQADQAATNWGTAKTLAYIDDNITGTSAGLSGTPNITVGTINSGAITTSGGISGFDISNGISGNNFNISGVNQLTINDPGEGIVFGGGSTVMSLAIVDDATDRILRYSGTGAVFDVQGNITLSGTVDGRNVATDGTKLDTIDTNADVTPSWVPSSNPNYLTSVPNHSAALITSGTLSTARLADSVPFGANGGNGTENTFTTDGGQGADNVTHSTFFRDNGQTFGALGVSISHPTNANYTLQIASTSYSNANDLKARVQNNGTWTTPVTLYSSGNSAQFTSALNTKLSGIATGADVTPSWVPSSNPGYITSADGGNATTLDSLDSTKFLRSDADDSYSGVLSLTGELTLATGTTRIDGSDGHPLVQVNSSRAYFGSTGRAVSTIATNSTTGLKANVSGTDYTVFHAGNSPQFTSTLNTKLSGIATGADVTPSWVPSSNPNYLTSVPNHSAALITSGTLPSARLSDNIFDSYRRDTIDSSSEDFNDFLTTGTYHVNNWAESGDVVANGPTNSIAGDSYAWGVLRVTNWQAASGSSSGTGTYVLQEYFPHNTDNVYSRIMWNGSFTGWRATWGSSNDGASSGLDADLLDGQHGSYYQNAGNLNAGTIPEARLPTQTKYLRSDANDDFSGTLNYTPDTGTILSVDGQAVLQRMTANGALTIGHDDAVIIAGGDTSGVLNTNISNATETVFLGAEGGVIMYAFPNNDTAWTNRRTFSFDGTNGINLNSNFTVDNSGNLSATTKSFDIPHPSKEGMRLRHGVLEGPENGVYVRGKSQEKVISLPEYWPDLIHEDSITVQLTAIGSGQELYVEKIEDNKVYVNGDNYFYYIQAERKDVERFEVEYNAN